MNQTFGNRFRNPAAIARNLMPLLFLEARNHPHYAAHRAQFSTRRESPGPPPDPDGIFSHPRRYGPHGACSAGTDNVRVVKLRPALELHDPGEQRLRQPQQNGMQPSCCFSDNRHCARKRESPSLRQPPASRATLWQYRNKSRRLRCDVLASAAPPATLRKCHTAISFPPPPGPQSDSARRFARGFFADKEQIIGRMRWRSNVRTISTTCRWRFNLKAGNNQQDGDGGAAHQAEGQPFRYAEGMTTVVILPGPRTKSRAIDRSRAIPGRTWLFGFKPSLRKIFFFMLSGTTRNQ